MKHFLLLLFFLLCTWESNSQEIIPLWLGQLGGSEQDFGNSVVTDLKGNVYFSGNFQGIADFDPGPGVYNLNSGGNGIFVCKFNSSGNLLWAKAFEGNSPFNTCESLAVDLNGNVYAAGVYRNWLIVDPGVDKHSIQSFDNGNGQDIFVCEFDSSGNYVWARSFGNAYDKSCHSIAVDVLGNTVITGFFGGSIDFDPSENVNGLSSAGKFREIYVVKLNANGGLVWAKQFSGNRNNDGVSVSIDMNFNIFATGFFCGILDVDPGPKYFDLYGAEYCEFSNTYICKLDSAGTFLWAKKIEHTGVVSSTNDSIGNLVLSGSFTGSFDFDLGPNKYVLKAGPDGVNSGFITKMDPAGNFLWARNITSINSSKPSNVCKGASISLSGMVDFTGRFSDAGTYDFGPGLHSISTKQPGAVFVGRVDPMGELVFLKLIYGKIYNSIYTKSIASDTCGNVYSTGFFGNYCAFEGDSGNLNISAPLNYDAYILKLGPEQLASPIQQTVANRESFKIYPNPTTGNLSFNFDEGCDLLRIVNTKGEVLFQEHNIGAGFYQAELGTYSAGLYIVEMKIKENSFRKKIIKIES